MTIRKITVDTSVKNTSKDSNSQSKDLLEVLKSKTTSLPEKQHKKCHNIKKSSLEIT